MDRLEWCPAEGGGLTGKKKKKRAICRVTRAALSADGHQHTPYVERAWEPLRQSPGWRVPFSQSVRRSSGQNMLRLVENIQDNKRLLSVPSKEEKEEEEEGVVDF